MARIATTVAMVVCALLVLCAGQALAMPFQHALAPAPRTTILRSTAIAQTTTTTRVPLQSGYARREAEHPQAAQFRGGDSFGVYIGGSAGLVIVVLLVLLLLR